MNILKNILNNLFSTKKQLTLHNIYLKNCTNKRDSLFCGQICKINADISNNDNEIFNLETLNDNYLKIGNFRNSDFEYCKNYNYAILYDIKNKNIEASIITQNVYIKKYKIDIQNNIKNGDVLTIKQINSNYCLFLDNKEVGKIIDYNFKKDLIKNIIHCQFEENKLVCIILK